ncbi:MAG: MFS transporter [Bacteroidota bacterium]
MRYLAFFKSHVELIIFGVMMTTLSSFGQTFLLSLYVPFLMDEFSISNSEISSFYGIATIVSATILPKLGKYIDVIPLKKYTAYTTVIFLCSLFYMSVNTVWWGLPIAFFGLRLAGQGLYTHISITSMSRYFTLNRGKAISLASLGHPLGQAVFPALILILITQIGWRESLWVNAGITAVIIFGFLAFVLKDKHLVTEESNEKEEITSTSSNVTLRQRDILKTRSFWILAPNMFFLSFTITGLFFFQFSIVEFKGWDPALIAGGLTVYALASSGSILLAGPLIDRHSAKTFFPYYLYPFLFALFLILFSSRGWVIFPYMILLGISGGFGSATVAALQVEFFGQKQIGAVRSVFTSLMVLSSAAGPAAFGLILDLGLSYVGVFIFSILLAVFVIIQSMRVIPSYRLAKWKYHILKKKG